MDNANVWQLPTLWQLLFYEVLGDRDNLRLQVQTAQARIEQLERELAARNPDVVDVDTLTDLVIDPPIPPQLQALWNNNH